MSGGPVTYPCRRSRPEPNSGSRWCEFEVLETDESEKDATIMTGFFDFRPVRYRMVYADHLALERRLLFPQRDRISRCCF